MTRTESGSALTNVLLLWACGLLLVIMVFTEVTMLRFGDVIDCNRAPKCAIRYVPAGPTTTTTTVGRR